MTCGSVDDGKSSLIGRLLFECGAVHADQLAALTADSARYGTRGGEPDYALLVDGLQAEREQGITIDVAYRYFGTARRRFIVADAPGHEQYTRNMITGASTADAAVLLVDAQKGLLTQTRRHMYLAQLMGIRNVAVAVNKMDLAGYDQSVFERIAAECRDFAAAIAVETLRAIPTSAVAGDNVRDRSANMPWYQGPTLLDWLEGVELDVDRERRQPFRLPVQLVTRSAEAPRGLAGTIVSGAVRCGEAVKILPGTRTATVARIIGGDGDHSEAGAGQAVTIALAEDVDCSRGDLLAAGADPPEVADQFEAKIIWLGETSLLPGRSYLLKLAGRKTGAVVQPPRYRVNVDTLEQLAADTLSLNEIGVAHVLLDAPIAFEPYGRNRDLGGFILIDRQTRETVAAGLIRFALRRSHNVRWQELEIDRAHRARIKGQSPIAIWLTGLSGAGKSTIANLLEQRLAALGRHTYLLDGDNLRHGLNRDLGFSDADRIENVRRVGEVARLMTDAGLIVLVAAISPFRAEREAVRRLFAPGEFIEVHVDVTLELAEARDPKGLYRKARAGSITNFTGIGSPYEAPEQPEVYVDTSRLSAEEAADLILAALPA